MLGARVASTVTIEARRALSAGARAIPARPSAAAGLLLSRLSCVRQCSKKCSKLQRGTKFS